MSYPNEQLWAGRPLKTAGAYADILVVNGNPLKDLGVLQNQGRDLHAIMKNGKFHKQQLAA